MKLDICIPTYEMRGKGVECLDFSLNRIKAQNYEANNIVICDSSSDDKIRILSSLDLS